MKMSGLYGVCSAIPQVQYRSHASIPSQSTVGGPGPAQRPQCEPCSASRQRLTTNQQPLGSASASHRMRLTCVLKKASGSSAKARFLRSLSCLKVFSKLRRSMEERVR
jgi:hypothetical protein